MSSDWKPSQRYPDPSVVSVTPEFDQYKLALAKVERVSTGYRWCEGPVWFGDQRVLIWSDVPGNVQYRWDEQTGSTSVYRQPSDNSNGNTRDREGRLLSCEHLNRRVVRTEIDGSRTVIADSFNGKPLNSPNDIVCKSDGSIWFTDPVFGILGNYEGNKSEPQLESNVYRVSPDAEITLVAEGIDQPNGLAFSPDEKILYIVESRGQPRKILALDVVKGLDGVHIFNSQGVLIGRIDLPERCANVCFGGLHRDRLFMAASTSVYSLFVNTQGVAGG